MRNQPQVSVGIMHADQIRFTLNDQYRLVEKNGITNIKGPVYQGDLTIELAEEGKLLFEGQKYKEIMFEPVEKQKTATFWLRDVVIGVNFHWERKEDQKFEGCLKFIVENGQVCPINILGVEDYLTSVISSEMSATANENLLKAHAVISRSWLLAQIEHADKEKQPSCTLKENPEHNCEELIKWYDRDDHNNFDVCADDHCQRYQGLTRASTEAVKKAIDQTWGEILSYEGQICDARFYKCCGGMLEEFENAWEDTHHDYLEVVRDSEDSAQTEAKTGKYGKDAAIILDLRDEDKAVAWIHGNPDAFCNTKDAQILGQVLNNYDQETADFYRWTVKYTQEEISNLVNTKSGYDFGQILDLVPIERGTSGRLIRLKIVGTKKTMIIGKELEIRRILSPSHLYSSAFVAYRLDENGKTLKKDSTKVPAGFELVGAGWGHGVGLCQIGAAVMGAKGYAYDAILYHYYPKAEIVKKY
jgi:SpoIID/LytB domain protein